MNLEVVRNWLWYAHEMIMHFLAPPLCYVCHVELSQHQILCKDCLITVIPVAPKLIKISNKYILTVHAASRYDGSIKKLILAKHYSGHIILRGLSKFVYENTPLETLPVDYFVPIPLHWSRKLKRGFNQADIMAEYYAKQKKKPVCYLLKRIKKTQYQARLSKELRDENVKGAFALRMSNIDIAGKHIMLVDDLCTTGSTAVQAAKVLLKYKPASVSLIAACRAL